MKHKLQKYKKPILRYHILSIGFFITGIFQFLLFVLHPYKE